MAGDIIKMFDFRKKISKNHKKNRLLSGNSLKAQRWRKTKRSFLSTVGVVQASIRVRDFPIRVFARHSSTPGNWQSQWVATDVWLGARSNRLDLRQSSVDQVQDARD